MAVGEAKIIGTTKMIAGITHCCEDNGRREKISRRLVTHRKRECTCFCACVIVDKCGTSADHFNRQPQPYQAAPPCCRSFDFGDGLPRSWLVLIRRTCWLRSVLTVTLTTQAPPLGTPARTNDKFKHEPSVLFTHRHSSTHNVEDNSCAQ